MSSTTDIAGVRFGRLVARARHGVDASRHVTWMCHCDCGRAAVVSGKSLRSRNTRSCGCSRVLPDAASAKNRLFRRYVSDAKLRRHSWALTEGEFVALTERNCHYCGDAPSTTQRSYGRGDDYIYNGVDRLDCDQGYSTENSVPCCAACNFAKQRQSAEQFVAMCQRVIDHQGKVA